MYHAPGLHRIAQRQLIAGVTVLLTTNAAFLSHPNLSTLHSPLSTLLSNIFYSSVLPNRQIIARLVSVDSHLHLDPVQNCLGFFAGR